MQKDKFAQAENCIQGEQKTPEKSTSTKLDLISPPYGKFSALSWKENFEKVIALILSLINEKTPNLKKIPGLLNVLKSKA